MVEKINQVTDAYSQVTKMVSIPNVVSPVYNDFVAQNPDLIKKRGEMVTKYIIGDISQEQFTKFLNDEYFAKTAAAEADIVAKANKALGK